MIARPRTRDQLEAQLAILAGMMPRGSKLVKLGGSFVMNAYEEAKRLEDIAIVTAAPAESPSITQGTQVHVPGAIWLPISLKAREELVQRGVLLMGEFVVLLKRSSVRSLPGRKDFTALAKERFSMEELHELLGMDPANGSPRP